jgi:hypothetical protein
LEIFKIIIIINYILFIYLFIFTIGFYHEGPFHIWNNYSVMFTLRLTKQATLVVVRYLRKRLVFFCLKICVHVFMCVILLVSIVLGVGLVTHDIVLKCGTQSYISCLCFHFGFLNCFCVGPKLECSRNKGTRMRP